MILGTQNLSIQGFLSLAKIYGKTEKKGQPGWNSQLVLTVTSNKPVHSILRILRLLDGSGIILN
jgi:hypothetical protein